MADKTPVRVVFNSDNVATGLGEFQATETVALSHGGTGTSLSIGTTGQVLRVNAAGTGLEFADQGDVDVIASSDSTGVQVQDDLNVSGTVSANNIDVNVLSSNDSTAIQINDNINIAGTLFASGTISTNDAATFGGNVTATGSFIIGSADLNETDLEKLDGITNGTAAANKALVADANIDVGTIRNLTATGTVNADVLDVQTIQSSDSTAIQIADAVNISGALNTETSLEINNSTVITSIVDEDGMDSNSNTALATQQSIKAYVDAQIQTKDNTDEMTEGSTNLYFTNARADARITAALIDEDNMSTNSATRLPSQQSVKAYVDNELSAFSTILNVVGDDSTDMEITLGTDRLFFQGGTNISTSTDSGAQLTISVDDSPTFSGTVTAGAFTIGSAAINEAELETIDGVTAGTVAANKALVVDGSKDIGTLGTITAATGDFQTIKVNDISSDDSSAVQINAIDVEILKSSSSTGIQVLDTLNVSGKITSATTPVSGDDVTTVSFVEENFAKAGFVGSTVTTFPFTDDSTATDFQGNDDAVGDTAAADAFGVALTISFDCMEPIGTIIANDFGASENFVGA